MEIWDAEELFGSEFMLNGGQDELIFPCPKCHEPGKQHKLYCNIESGLFKCWRCGHKGKVDLSMQLRERFANVERKPPAQLSDLYPQPVRIGTSAGDYLQNRGFGPDIWTQYGLSISPLDNFAGGIIIPALDEQYRGYTIRIFDRSQSRKWRDYKDRYYNSPGFRRVDTLYNYARVKGMRQIRIAEGSFSTIAAGQNAIGTYGKDVSDDQFNRILALNAEEYVVCTDGDAPWWRTELCAKLYAHGRTVTVVMLPEKEDPNSVPDFEYYLKHREEVDEFWLMKQKCMSLRH